MWTDFQNFFTNWFVRKFSIYTPQRFPPHLPYAATLPCETGKSKNVTDFGSIFINQLVKQFWKSIHICQKLLTNFKWHTIVRHSVYWYKMSCHHTTKWNMLMPLVRKNHIFFRQNSVSHRLVTYFPLTRMISCVNLTDRLTSTSADRGLICMGTVGKVPLQCF